MSHATLESADRLGVLVRAPGSGGFDRFQILVDVAVDDSAGGMIGDPAGDLAQRRLIKNARGSGVLKL